MYSRQPLRLPYQNESLSFGQSWRSRYPRKSGNVYAWFLAKMATKIVGEERSGGENSSAEELQKNTALKIAAWSKSIARKRATISVRYLLVGNHWHAPSLRKTSHKIHTRATRGRPWHYNNKAQLLLLRNRSTRFKTKILIQNFLLL